MARLPPRKGWSQGTETMSMASGAGGPLHCSLCFCAFETFPQNNVLGKSSEQHPNNKNKKNGNFKKNQSSPHSSNRSGRITAESEIPVLSAQGSNWFWLERPWTLRPQVRCHGGRRVAPRRPPSACPQGTSPTRVCDPHHGAPRRDAAQVWPCGSLAARTPSPWDHRPRAHERQCRRRQTAIPFTAPRDPSRQCHLSSGSQGTCSKLATLGGTVSAAHVQPRLASLSQRKGQKRMSL